VLMETFGAIALVLARRATRIDPVVAPRHE
jgi:hypothetical protein